jgi:hypothetical protein
MDLAVLESSTFLSFSLVFVLLFNVSIFVIFCELKAILTAGLCGISAEDKTFQISGVVKLRSRKCIRCLGQSLPRSHSCALCKHSVPHSHPIPLALLSI